MRQAPKDETADKASDKTPDKTYVLLRRELVRAQARLKRAERERDAARAEKARLTALLRAHGIAPSAPDQ
jgi:hypothetical protein